MGNYQKKPVEWDPDIAQSVSDYNAWFTAHAPRFWSEARERAAEAIASLMASTADLRELSPDCLVAPSDLLTVLRAATAPPIAKERLVTLANVRISVVNRLHKGEGLPIRWKREELTRLTDRIATMLDPVTFPWVREDRAPTELERAKALLIVGDRTTSTFYNPLLRNEQEARQVVLMRGHLKSLGYEPVAGSGIDMPPRTYTIHRNVPYETENGDTIGLTVDCVVNPGDGRPVALIEMKSAGDFTNVNKRRKEEASKAINVRRKHGDKVAFLLQLSGHFNRGYCTYAVNESIDWAWDHRLADLDQYLA